MGEEEIFTREKTVQKKLVKDDFICITITF